MTLMPGDIGFHHDTDLQSGLIRWAEARKYGRAHGPDDPAYWNHTFMITQPPDVLVEADPSGVALGNLTEYPDHVVFFRPPYADSTLRTVGLITAMIGERYGDLHIMSDAVYLLFKTTLRFGFAGKHTCSGLVARVLTLSGIDMGDDEEWNSPADNFKIAVDSHWIKVAPG
jgi:hypothetical protein